MSEVENAQDAAETEPFELPPASFQTLAGMLISQAEFALLSFETEKGRHEPDLRVARHVIDLLAILQDKTKGNLSLEEERLVGNSLTELRFRFVQALEDSRKRAADNKKEETEGAQA
jgi:hypothetical protein